MQFIKALSVFALAATSVHAVPEPAAPAPAVGANGTISVTGVSDALTTVLGGLVHLGSSNTAIVHALIEDILESGEEDAASTATAISGLLGQSAAYAQSLTTILTAIEVCVGGNA